MSPEEEEEEEEEDCLDLNDQRDEEACYWIRVACQDEGMEVEAYNGDQGYADEFIVKKVRLCFYLSS
jgi:hypothetical protein